MEIKNGPVELEVRYQIGYIDIEWIAIGFPYKAYAHLCSVYLLCSSPLYVPRGSARK